MEIKTSYDPKLYLNVFQSSICFGGPAPIPMWKLIAFPVNDRHCFLEISLQSDEDFHAEFQFTVMKNGPNWTEKWACIKTKIFSFKLLDAYTVHIDLQKSIKDMLPRSTLSVICDVSVHSNIVKLQHLKSLSEDLESVFDRKECSDVTLVVGGQEIKAHKVVLVARSKVFAAMFRHEMEEHTLNRVSINDINHEVVEEMVRYMYTGKVPNLDTMAEELLAAADMYALDMLKQMCLQSMQMHINVEKAGNTLILADRFNAPQLKQSTIDFIIANAKGVVETQGWKDMIITHAYLIAEAFCAAVIKP